MDLLSQKSLPVPGDSECPASPVEELQLHRCPIAPGRTGILVLSTVLYYFEFQAIYIYTA